MIKVTLAGRLRTPWRESRCEDKQGFYICAAYSHMFILGVCPTTEGEYALSETMPYLRKGHQDYHGLRHPTLLPAYQ